MAAVTCKVGSVAANTSTGNQDVTVETGFGQPQAGVIWVTKATADNTETVHGQICVGMFDDAATPNQVAMGMFSRDNVATSNTGRWTDQAAVLVLADETAAGNQALGNKLLDVSMPARTGWPTDGFRLSIDATDGTAYVINYIVYGGGVNAQLDTVTLNTASVNVTTSWQATAWISGLNTLASTTDANDAYLSLGFASFDGVSTFKHACATYYSDDAQGTCLMEAGSWTNGLWNHHSGGAVRSRATITASTSSLYTVTRSEGTSNRTGYILALNFDDATGVDVGNYTTPTATGTASVTLSWEPCFFGFISNLIEDGSEDAIQTSAVNMVGGLGLGAVSYDGTTSAERAGSVRDDDAATTMDNSCRVADATVSQADVSGTLDSRAIFDSAGASSITFDWTTAPSTAQRLPWLAIENTAAGGGGADVGWMHQSIKRPQQRALASM